MSVSEGDEYKRADAFIRRGEADYRAGRPMQSGNYWYIFAYLEESKMEEPAMAAMMLCVPRTIPNKTLWGSLTDD